MAVLRQCALQSLVEILTLHQGHRVRLALKSWLNSVRQVQLHQHHARTAAEASRASDRLAEKHEGNVAQLRKEWKHARQAMMQSQQHEMNDDELQKLRDLDKRYRRQMAEMHDSHEELQGEHRSAHKEAQTMCKKNIKVLAMGVLESLATRTGRTGRGDDWPQGDSPSVCFMQWAFTQNPEAWCPLPPARDLKHAMVLSEQRSQLAFFLRQLQETLQGLPQALRAAAAQRHPGGNHREELIPKQTAVAARLLRRALQNILWKRLGCFLHRLIGLRPLPRSSHRSAGAGAQSGAPLGRRSVARQGAHAQRSSAFFLGEDFGDIQRSPPTTAHELHGTQSLRDAKASKTAHPKMQTEDAALKIQSVERGGRARKSMKLQMQATMSPPVASERPVGPTAASVHGAVVEQPPPSHPSHLPALPPVPLKVQEAAATKIQAHLRGRIGRKVVAQKKKVFSRRSALKLIAAKPGPSGPSGPSSPAPQVTDAEKRTPSKAAAVPRMRRSVSAKRPDSALEDEPSPEEASMGHLPPPPEVLHAAAVKIQSAARGHKGRQKAAALAAAQRRQQAPEHRATEEAEEAEEEDLESDEEYYEARRVTHLGPALTE